MNGQHAAGNLGFARHVGAAVSAVTEGLARTGRGLAHEVQALATHAALYPTGVRPSNAASAHTWRHTGLREVDTGEWLPVVAVHGMFHNRSGFHFMARALDEAGVPLVDADNYSTFTEDIPAIAARLGRRVAQIRRATGADRVNLVGHSLGGIVARWYVQEGGGAEAVDQCVTISTPHRGTYTALAAPGRAGRDLRPSSPVMARLERSLRRSPVRFVNVYTDADAVILPTSSATLPWSPRITNHLVPGFGHASLLLATDTIRLVVSHLATAPSRGRSDRPSVGRSDGANALPRAAGDGL